MTQHHKLKLRSTYWDAVMLGEKCFELRLNDRGFQKGDTVFFGAVEGDAQVNYVKNSGKFIITYVHSGLGLEKDYVVFGIKQIE